MASQPELTREEAFLLNWLGVEDSSTYGECKCRSLDGLIELGYVETDPQPTDYSRVSLTEAGWQRLKAEDR